MTDKVQKIKEELERRVESMNSCLFKTAELGSEKFNDGELYAYKQILQFIDSIPEESVSDNLEEAAKEYSFNIPTQFEVNSVWKKETEQHFKDGAKYHEDKMKEALQAEYEKGLFDMREEMMKNTVLETKVMMDSDGDGIETPYEEWLTLENTEILSLPDNLGLKDGDRVKILIVKDD